MKRIIFLKGLAIGVCDVIPGISAGTIAFITGIYTRLIEGIKAYSPASLIRLFDKKQRKDVIKSLDLGFFIPLILGIGIALYIASYFIPYLLQQYFVFTMSFFIGLVVASAFYIFTHITQHNKFNHLMGVFGFVLGFSLAYIIPLEATPTYLFIFLAGFIALCATLLPGISGSYILLILGQYEFVYTSIHMISERYMYLLAFFVGALLGIMLMARIVSYALHHWKSPTLYLLLGLVLGSLNTPVKRIISDEFVWSLGNSLFVLILFILGAGIVLLLERIRRKKKIY